MVIWEQNQLQIFVKKKSTVEAQMQKKELSFIVIFSCGGKKIKNAIQSLLGWQKFTLYFKVHLPYLGGFAVLLPGLSQPSAFSEILALQENCFLFPKIWSGGQTK